MVLKGYLFFLLLCLCAIGCTDDYDVIPIDVHYPAEFVRVTPASGEIPVNGIITVFFDNPPADIKVSTGSVRVAGKIVTIWGPFIPGPLVLTITWADGTHALKYAVIGPDTDPPIVTGGTVKDGEKDVDPEDINFDGQIVVEFSEDVSGIIALRTKGGDNVGWCRVDGNRAVLELAWGKEISNETTYVIKGKVSDVAGNTIDVSITFVTRRKA